MNRRDFITATALSAAVPALLNQAAAAPRKGTAKMKVLVPASTPEEMAILRAAAPTLELVPFQTDEEALELVKTADAVYGFITPELIRAGKSLKWVQQSSAGVEHLMDDAAFVESHIILTNMQRAYAPQIADQALGYLIGFTRGMSHFIRIQPKQDWPQVQTDVVLDELPGKTLLTIGLGGIGSEIARRAAAFGMRVLATDPKVIERPLTVAELHRPEALGSLLPQADIVVSSVPLTKVSRKMLGAREFAMMKPGVLFINVSRGGVVDTDALVAALDSKHVAGAGLDVTDPEPLPKGHPLWTRNVIITPHNAGQSTGVARRRLEVTRENLRRFAAGESLINVVDKSVGY